MSLPLLRFPFLALKVILNHMKDIELIKVSLCSKKAERILKACGKEELSFFENGFYDGWNCLDAFELSFLEAKRAPGSVCTEFELDIKVELDTTPRISVEYDDNFIPGYRFEIESIGNIDEYTGRRRDLFLNGTRVPIVLTDDGMYIFWDGVVDGLLFLLKCYNKRFSTVSYSLEYYAALDSADLKKFVDYTSSLIVKDVTVAQNAEISVEDYKYIVESSKLSDPEERQTLFNSYFEHDEVIQINNQIKADNLRISSGNLISFQYLLECDHIHVDVENSKFTNGQIKHFMEQWMNKKFPKLYSIRLGMSETINFEHVLEVLPVCEKSEKWWCSREKSPKYFLLVERDDGVIAILRKLDSERFIMKVEAHPLRKKNRGGESSGEEDDDDGEDEEEDEDGEDEVEGEEVDDEEQEVEEEEGEDVDDQENNSGEEEEDEKAAE